MIDNLLTYQAPKDLLADKIILVTGAGSGIGRSAALSFAEHGATVVLLGRTTSKLEQVYDEIEAAGYPQAAIYPMNLEGATLKDFDDMANTLDENFGRLDGLLHNAAILGSLTPLHQYDATLWMQVFQVNFHAPYFMTQACFDLLRKAQAPSVIFSSDQVGREGKAYWGAYAAAKAAQENTMQMWTKETMTNTHLRFNSLDPGAVKTFMRSRAYPMENPQNLHTPEQIMPAYLYLMGTDSQDVNGQMLSVEAPTTS
jgi:NAD(P)-dependent dehydrogenase (short-subunit alcohol dehydrogenase family)